MPRIYIPGSGASWSYKGVDGAGRLAPPDSPQGGGGGLAPNNPQIFTESLQDTVISVDSIVDAYVPFGQLTDTIILSDTITSIQIFTVTLSDSITSSDSIVDNQIFTITLSDSITSLDSIVDNYIPAGGAFVLPSDRSTTWAPGVTYGPTGAIPTRNTIYTTLSPIGGGSDDTSQIQTAINNCPSGQVVLLSAGVFIVNNLLFLNKSNITLRGAGMGLTILYKNDGAQPGNNLPGNQAPVVIVGTNRWSNNPTPNATNFTVDGAKGATSITVASSTGFVIGDLVLIDELSGADWRTDPQGNGLVLASADYRVVWKLHSPGQAGDDPIAFDNVTKIVGNGSDAASWFCRQDRPTCEIKKIQDISGNTITFTTPLHISYRTGHTAQMVQLNQMTNDFVRLSGVEDLSMHGGSEGNIRYHWTDECWGLRIESYEWLNEGMCIDGSFRTELRECKSRDAVWPYPGGGGYAWSFQGGCADCLIEDSWSVRANKVMVSRSSGAGCVVGYNYVDDGYIGYNGRWQEVQLNGSHMVGPHHILFEGNHAPNADSDVTHGNAICHTYYRNYLTGFRRNFTNAYAEGGDNPVIDDVNQMGTNGPLRCMGLQATSYWHSFVGNVCGTPGQMASWAAYGHFGVSNGIRFWGWDSNSAANYAEDPNVSDSNFAGHVIDHGNYDYKDNTQTWDADYANHTLSNSFYLNGTPAFFTSGGYAWPWVDPGGATNADRVKTLPAKARYDAEYP